METNEAQGAYVNLKINLEKVESVTKEKFGIDVFDPKIDLENNNDLVLTGNGKKFYFVKIGGAIEGGGKGFYPDEYVSTKGEVIGFKDLPPGEFVNYNQENDSGGEKEFFIRAFEKDMKAVLKQVEFKNSYQKKVVEKLFYAKPREVVGAILQTNNITEMEDALAKLGIKIAESIIDNNSILIWYLNLIKNGLLGVDAINVEKHSTDDEEYDEEEDWENEENLEDEEDDYYDEVKPEDKYFYLGTTLKMIHYDKEGDIKLMKDYYEAKIKTTRDFYETDIRKREERQTIYFLIIIVLFYCLIGFFLFLLSR